MPFLVEPERYFDAICEALKKTGAGVLLPAQAKCGIFCQRRNELNPGVRVALPKLETYRMAEDKLAVLDVARRTGCPVPSTTEAPLER